MHCEVIFTLQQNSPNPFNQVTTINYDLKKKEYVELLVYDLLGKKVATLVDEEQSIGSYSYTFNALNFSGGLVNFEQLEVWKRSCHLSSEVYTKLRDLRDFGFKDQITRSSLSVPSNIAEGMVKPTPKDKTKYLHPILKGAI